MTGPVISNASPLIGLASIDRLLVLRQLWGEVILPEAVYREVVVAGAGRSGAASVGQACGDWMRVVPAQDQQEVSALRAALDEGEAEVIVLGQELHAGLLLLDNREPRVFARGLGLPVMGTLGVLLAAWRKGLVEDPLRDAQRLRQVGFWLDDKLFDLLKAQISSQQCGLPNR